MSLLTKEQQDTLERIRKAPFDPAASYDHLCTAISIIDDLQARARKQYTEQELREAAAKGPFALNEKPSEIELEYFDLYCDGWLDGAEFVGALKAEP